MEEDDENSLVDLVALTTKRLTLPIKKDNIDSIRVGIVSNTGDSDKRK